jgi:hypothetical protein
VGRDARQLAVDAAAGYPWVTCPVAVVDGAKDRWAGAREILRNFFFFYVVCHRVY